MLKRPRRIRNYQKMRSNMPCSLMDPVVLWESIGGGRLLYRVLYDKLQKLLKKVVMTAEQGNKYGLSAKKKILQLPSDHECMVHKKLGGGTARTADPNWPKGYSIPYDVMLSIETGGSWPGGSDRCSGMGWALVGR
ncbi:hypothetical protein QYF61_019589, partial [Mycteria americana]